MYILKHKNGIFTISCNIELIDKGISVSTLESGLGGEVETIQRLTERMEISLQHTLLGKLS